MDTFGFPKGAELAPTVGLCARTDAEWAPVWLLTAVAGLLLLAGVTLASMARADDGKVFADLIPGEQLEEVELEQLHGRGVSLRGLSRFGASLGASAGKGLRERLLGNRDLKSMTRSVPKAPRLGGTTFSRGGVRRPQTPRTDVRDKAGDRGLGGRAHSIGLARSLSGRDYGP